MGVQLGSPNCLAAGRRKAGGDARGAGGAPQLAGRVGLPNARLFKVL